MEQQQAYIRADQSAPEITLSSIILSILLAILFAGTNTYIALRAGIAISVSIPAAIISMGILRFLPGNHLLENNIVQTGASSGGIIVAGVVYTLPALLMLQFWHHINYWPTVMVMIVGGTIGVLFSVPLRRVLLAERSLTFPEGTAVGNLLIASADKSSGGFKQLTLGSLAGAALSLCQTGFKVITESWQIWFAQGKSIYGIAFGFSPALIAAGYIIGISTCISILVGTVLGWLIGVPIFSHLYVESFTDTSLSSIANQLWQQHIRYVGVGCLFIGGITTVFNLLRPMAKALRTSYDHRSDTHTNTNALRTEADIPLKWVILGSILFLIPLFILLVTEAQQEFHSIFSLHTLLFAGLSLTFITILGFLMAAVCGYFAGLVGSSLNPNSAMSLIVLLLSSSGVLLFLNITLADEAARSYAWGAAAAILLTMFTATIASISNDTIQDLKTGHMLGATPWKQQVMLILGVIVAAFVTPVIIQVLYQGYGILGAPPPHSHMNMSTALAAPQASLMATVAKGVFARDLPIATLLIGIGIGTVVYVIDRILIKRKANFRLPPLAVGIGIYLPIATSTPLIIGGIIAWLAKRPLRSPALNQDVREQAEQRGMLIASGMVAGAAIIGIALAIPFAILGSTDILRLLPENLDFIADITGFLSIIAIAYWLKKAVTPTRTSA